MLIQIPDKWLLVADAIIRQDVAQHIDLVYHAHAPRLRVATVAAFLECGPCRPATDRGHYTNSQCLKHDVERWGNAMGFAPYVAGGDVTAVAHALGVLMVPHCTHSPDCSDFMLALRLEKSWEEGQRVSYASTFAKLCSTHLPAAPTKPDRPSHTQRRTN